MLDRKKLLADLTDYLTTELGSLFGREAFYILNPTDLKPGEINLIENLSLVFENIRLIDVRNTYNFRINYLDFLCVITEDASYMKGVIKLAKFGVKKGGYILQIFESNFERCSSAKLHISGFKIVGNGSVTIDNIYSCRFYRKL